MLKKSLFLSSILLLSACGDPYDAKLSGPVSPAQAEKIADQLPAKDRELFLRWNNRQARGEVLSIESSPPNVKTAINNQILYEARKAEENEAAEKEKKEKEAKRLQEIESNNKLLQEAERQRQHRTAVHNTILESISVTAKQYRLQPFFDQNNYPIGKNWVFEIEVQNKTKKPVLGLAGYVTLKDAFGNQLGSYPFKFEENIQPSKTVTLSLFMLDDINNANHQKMKGTSNLFQQWSMESLVFKDGTRIDAQSVPSPRP